MNQDLYNYIEQGRIAGMTDSEMRQELLKAGWETEEIDSLLLSGVAKTAPRTLAMKKRFSPWKIIVPFIILLLLGAGYYLYDQKLIPGLNNENKDTNETVGTEDWKDWDNYALAFKVKIPNDYIVTNGILNNGQTEISIEVLPKPELLDQGTQLVTESIKIGSADVLKVISVNGQPARGWVVTDYPKPDMNIYFSVEDVTNQDLEKIVQTFTPMEYSNLNLDLKVNSSHRTARLGYDDDVTISWDSKNTTYCVSDSFPNGRAWSEKEFLNPTGQVKFKIREILPPKYSSSFMTLQLSCYDGEVGVVDSLSQRLQATKVAFDTVFIPIDTSTFPAVTVVSPNGGEEISQGQTVQVKWTTQPQPDAVSINLFKVTDSGATLLEQVAKDIPNSGNYNWKVNLSKQNYTAGQKYKLLIQFSDIASVNDYSDNTFTIK